MADALTRDQAAILTAHTGILCGPFEDFHAYATKLLGRPVFTHEFGREEMADKIRDLSRDDFLAILPTREAKP